MSAPSLNPNHPTSRALSDEWHKLAGILVNKAGGHVVITMEDLEDMPQDAFITVEELHDGIHLRMVDRKTAERLARENGGLPS